MAIPTHIHADELKPIIDYGQEGKLNSLQRRLLTEANTRFRRVLNFITAQKNRNRVGSAPKFVAFG